MKLKILLIVNLLISFLCTNLTAQNYEYFTAFEGIPTAKAKVDELKLSGAKLVFIGGNDTISNKNSKNLCSKGKAFNWYYIFSYNNDERLLTLSLTKQNGIYNPEKINDYPSDSQPNGNVYFFISSFKEIPTTLFDSDSKIVLQHSYSTTILPDTGLSRIECSSFENIYFPTDSSAEFVWVVAQVFWIDYGFPDKQREVGIYIISAINGDVLDEAYTVGVKDNLINDKKYDYPNPTSDILYLPELSFVVKFPVQIFSLEGVLVFETEYKEQIDASRLAPGVYFLKLNNRMYKFVKI